MSEHRNLVIQNLSKRFDSFCKQTDVSVRTMVQTYERKKNAYAIKKTTYRKSGSLDLKKIAQHKTSEHIFQKKMIQPKMKNEKVVILVDWSGSIRRMMEPIVMQAINVAQFCKKAGIDFSVYGFIDNHEILAEVNVNRTALEDTREDHREVSDRFVLAEFLSHTMSQKEFSQGCRDLYTVSFDDARREYWNHKNSDDFFSLNGTPLNSALVTLKDLFAMERAKYHSYNLMILTDGESSDMCRYNPTGASTVFIDAKDNKAIPADGDYYDYYKKRLWQTSMLLGLIKNMGINNTIFYFYTGKVERTMSQYIKETISKAGVHTISSNWINNCKEIFYINANAMFNLNITDFEASLVDDEDEDFDEEEIWDEETGEYYYAEPTKQQKSSAPSIQVEANASIKSITQTFTKNIESEKVKKLVGVKLVETICESYAA